MAADGARQRTEAGTEERQRAKAGRSRSRDRVELAEGERREEGRQRQWEK